VDDGELKKESINSNQRDGILEETWTEGLRQASEKQEEQEN
jgi:hypothetical protein